MAEGNLLNLSITGTTHQVVASAPSGAVTLSLPASVQIDTSILDSNANTILGMTPHATSVNYLSLSNAETGANPIFQVHGTDTDRGIDLIMLGAGSLQIYNTGTNPGRVNLFNSAVTANVGISAPVTVTGTYTMFLPGTAGDVNTVMQNDGAGNLSWVRSGSFPFTTTAAAAGTTTLTATSTYYQAFSGTTTQTVVLPVVSTLSLGTTFVVISTATAVITVNSSGGNLVEVVTAGNRFSFICILTSGTTAASWYAG